jgi:hypothetical protein
MTIKIALAVALGSLFVAAPSATLKGAKPQPAGLTLSLTCNDILDGNQIDTTTDFCSVTVTNLLPGAYAIYLLDSCGNIMHSTGGDGPSFSFGYTFSEPNAVFGCPVTSVTANLYRVGKGGAQTLLLSATTVI